MRWPSDFRVHGNHGWSPSGSSLLAPLAELCLGCLGRARGAAFPPSPRTAAGCGLGPRLETNRRAETWWEVTEGRRTKSTQKYRRTAGMVRFKFNFDDLIFWWKRNFTFRVERKSTDLPLKILNSFNGVTSELFDGPTRGRSPQWKQARKLLGSLSRGRQWWRLWETPQATEQQQSGGK